MVLIKLKTLICKSQVPIDSNIKKLLASIKYTALGIAFIIDKKSQVLGVATDGDIRNILLKNIKITDNCKLAMNENFVYLNENYTEEEVIKKFDENIRIIPILDSKKRLLKIIDKTSFVPDHNVEIYTKVPARLSLSGGGTDFTSFFVEEDGLAITLSINLYTHIRLIKRSDQVIKINSVDFNFEKSFKNINDIKPSGKLKLILSAIKKINPNYGFDLKIKSDFKPSSGLGGSAAVLVGIISSFLKLDNTYLDNYKIAALAYEIERHDLNIKGGWQDQYSAVFGGFNLIKFSSKSNLVIPIKIDDYLKQDLEKKLILCDLGIMHNGNKKNYSKVKITSNRKTIQKLKELTENTLFSLLKFETDYIGYAFKESMKIKKTVNPDSINNKIEKIINRLYRYGAKGIRILGTGGGGHLLIYLADEDIFKLTNEIVKMNLKIVDFQIECKGIQNWLIKN